MDVAELLASFAKRRVLVIGDTVIDAHTDLEEIKKLDDGTPVYRTILDERHKSTRYSLGGAALVVRNLLELGAKVDFLTAHGYGQAALAATSFSHRNLSTHAIQVGKPQTLKHRFWCGGKKVMQVDTVDNTPLDRGQEGWLLDEFDNIIVQDDTPDAIVIADYRHGLMSLHVAQNVSPDYGRQPVFVASQVAQSETNHDWYDGSAIFVMNEREWDAWDRHKLSIRRFVRTFSDWQGSLYMAMPPFPYRAESARAIKVGVVDSCGAGDAFLAALSLSGDLRFANIWAGLSCTVRGANPPTTGMLKQWVRENESGLQGDVLGVHRDSAQMAGGHEAHHDARGLS